MRNQGREGRCRPAGKKEVKDKVYGRRERPANHIIVRNSVVSSKVLDKGKEKGVSQEHTTSDSVLRNHTRAKANGVRCMDNRNGQCRTGESREMIIDKILRTQDFFDRQRKT